MVAKSGGTTASPRSPLGKRKGVRVAFGQSRYVTRIDAETATVTVGPAENLLAAGMAVEDMNWLTSAPTGESLEVDVQIRYRHRAVPMRARQ